MSSWIRRLRGSRLAQNAAALYGAHFVGLVVPLIALPYLARVLRPEGWGLVVFCQSLAAWLSLMLEYGFYLSATREIARVRGKPEEVADVVRDVQSARFLLLGLISTAVVLAYVTVPVFRRNPEYLFWTWLIAVTQGFNPYWYYQGIERMRIPAVAEAAAKAAATVGIFLLIRQETDGWMALALYGVAGLVWVAATNLWIYSEVPFRGLQVSGGIRMLMDAAGLFVFRSASGIYIQANAFIYGILVGAPAVAFFGGAERIIRGAINLIHPATQALYPRISHLVQREPREAGRLLWLSLLSVGGLGMCISVVAVAAAPALVRVFLGDGYEAAVPLLRAMALLPPLIAVSTVIGIQWALPMGYDRPFYQLVIAAGLVNAVAAVILVPRFGGLGMVAAIVLAECVVAGGLLLLVIRRGREFWSTGLRRLFASYGRPSSKGSIPTTEA